MEKQGKVWETPQLIILAKAEPEENVLASCKTMNPNQQVSGPNDMVQQATCAQGVEGNCSNCQSRGVSATS